MSTYIIGDIHGCYKELIYLLKKSRFNKNKDILWITGDLVFRGKFSLEVLQFLYSIRKNVKIVLGNNDLNLIKMHFGLLKILKHDATSKIFKHADCDILISWLRLQPFVQVDHKKKIIMSHAGIPSFWNVSQSLKYSQILSDLLSGKDFLIFMNAMCIDNERYTWNNNLTDYEKIKFSINAFTQMRYCFLNNDLEMTCKTFNQAKGMNIKPWFDFPSRVLLEKYSIIFGHWSSLLGKGLPENIIGLDTGCCWGGYLTMLRWEDKKIFRKKCFS